MNRSGRPVEARGCPEHSAVVFLHGFLGAAADWEGVWQLLAPRHDCIGFDLPGHGRSVGLPGSACTPDGAAALVESALDGMKIGRCALAGYSMGGRLALALAQRNPARWTALALISAAPGPEDEASRAARRAADEELAARLEREPLPAFLEAWYRQPLFASLWEDPALREAVLQRRLRNDPAELARALRGLGAGAQPPLWGALGRLEMPVLLAAGGRDARYAALARRMEGLCRRGRSTIVPGAGHAVHLEAPEALGRCLLQFLEDAPGMARTAEEV